MWPKALLQLLELAPHITRLVPAADRYLQSRTVVPESQRRALEEMAAGLRTELGKIEGGLRGDITQVAAAQAGIGRQVNQQSETLAGMAADVRTMRLANDEMEARLARIEMQTARIWVALLVGLGWIFVAVVVGIVVLRIR